MNNRMLMSMKRSMLAGVLPVVNSLIVISTGRLLSTAAERGGGLATQ